MSEMINNREFRQKVLKELIMELHDGKTVEEVKPRFEHLIQGVSTKEISEMEQALVMEGMPIEEIQNLCDVHAAVFKGSIEEIHQPRELSEMPGHPIHMFLLENRAIEKLLEQKIMPALEQFEEAGDSAAREPLLEGIRTLLEIDKHYARKENLLFPYMEKYGITAPPKVMWGVDDEIRDSVKAALKTIQESSGTQGEIRQKIEEASHGIREMIYKEENILFPMVAETLTEDEWFEILTASDEIGYTLVKPHKKWKPDQTPVQEGEAKAEFAEEDTNTEGIRFDAGVLTAEEANAMLNTLPLDITFVDKEGVVKYFTQGKERIFPRPLTVLGREVKNCHPPASVHIVEQIVVELKSGVKDHEDFWINMNGMYVYIRYYAVRNAQGEFLGVMEVTQDIKPIQEITGEKRLVSES